MECMYVFELKYEIFNECFTKNWFVKGLEAWKANIDIQPVFNLYEEITLIQKMKHWKH